MSSFNPNAKTPVELMNNCQFQLDNVKGWLLAMADFPTEDGPVISAEMKAECLVNAAESLNLALKSIRQDMEAEGNK